MKPTDETSKKPQDRESILANRESYYIDDHALRVRLAREAAQRKIDEFGDVSEYVLKKIYGRLPNSTGSRDNAPQPLKINEGMPFDKSDEES